MTKKMKLSLDNLKVQSFVTSEEAKDVKGGESFNNCPNTTLPAIICDCPTEGIECSNPILCQTFGCI